VGVLSDRCHLFDQRFVAKDMGALSNFADCHHHGPEYAFLEHELSEFDRVSAQAGGSVEDRRLHNVSVYEILRIYW
jgi:hypothetical protein